MMASRDILDGSRNNNISDGLHNLLTGLTAHSPGSSSPTNATGASSLSPTSTTTIEQTLFNTPNRSIFASGPPTSSLSVSTAQASLSGAVATNSSRPLAALTGPSSNTSRSRGASAAYPDVGSSNRAQSSSFHQAQKDVDDPTTPMELNSSLHTNAGLTPTALTRLFAGTSVMGPSRQASYNLSADHNKAIMETASLPEHLYTRGFRDGRHSDITVHAFSTAYALHRIILDRAPFFASALSGPWYESHAKEITLHPAEVDSNITRTSFELALKRLYGAVRAEEERQEAAALLATGCWLEMTDLVNTSVEYLMRQMAPATLSEVIDLVTNNYYGKPGERLLSTAKAMLAREGWQMPLRYWDGISGALVRQIIGGDGFFVAGEWDRWILAKRLFNRKLKVIAIEHGVCSSDRPSLPVIIPEDLDDSRAEQSSSSLAEKEDPIKAVYAQSDIAALVVLLEQGIHYAHMTFEQLQYIQNQKDVLGRPLVQAETILKALWMATELRQRIVNAPDTAIELGLKQIVHDAPQPSDAEAEASESMTRHSSTDSTSSAESIAWARGKTDSLLSYSGLPACNGQLRKFWIPTADSTRVVGDKAEANSRSGASGSSARNDGRREDGSDPFLTHLHDSKWPSKVSAKSSTLGKASSREKPAYRHYSVFPPFRFSVEFQSPRTMKEKKRVYSQTVWYAGSMWNVYIQKVQASKNMQLGVYLHRVRDREGEDLLGASAAPRSVDEAIGQLEREMLMRRQDRRPRQQGLTGDFHTEGADENGNSSGDNNNGIRTSGRKGGLGGLVSATRKGQKSAMRPYGSGGQGYGPDDESEDEGDQQLELALKRMAAGIPALPPYIDGRPTIRTYFKIYQMSPEGKTLSVHKSAPDVFNFSQSWGWKSVLDETILGSNGPVTGNAGDIDISSSTGAAGGMGSASGTHTSSSAIPALSSTSRDEKLRFSIVLGNV